MNCLIIAGKKNLFIKKTILFIEIVVFQFSDSLKYIKEMENYTRLCLQSSSKRVASILTYTLKSQFKSLCAKDNQRRRDLLEAAECANNGSDEIQKCNIRIIDAFLGIQNAQDSKIKVPLICW